MYNAPNYINIPNSFIDDFMGKATLAQFKCMMTILRYTIGWHKQSAEISFSEFVRMTGLSESEVLKAITELEELDYILVKRSSTLGKNSYAIKKYSEENE